MILLNLFSVRRKAEASQRMTHRAVLPVGDAAGPGAHSGMRALDGVGGGQAACFLHGGSSFMVWQPDSKESG